MPFSGKVLIPGIYGAMPRSRQSGKTVQCAVVFKARNYKPVEAFRRERASGTRRGRIDSGEACRESRLEHPNVTEHRGRRNESAGDYGIANSAGLAVRMANAVRLGAITAPFNDFNERDF